MFWFRVDNRLVHGQVIEAWLPYLRAKRLVVINNALAENLYQQQIMRLAIPGRVEVIFATLDAAKALYDRMLSEGKSALFLMKNCQDARRLYNLGIGMSKLNVANMHYSPGKRQLCAHISASDEDVSCFQFFREHDVSLDFRCIPGENPRLEEW